MYNYKHKQSKIFNKDLILFPLFCLCAILYLGCIIDPFYLLFLLLLPISLWRCNINKVQILILVGIPITFIFLIVFAPNFSLVYYLTLKNPIRTGISNFFDQHYEQETADFIKLILLNIKSQNTYVFYKQVVDLGVVWLFCMSGFHISLLSKIIRKIFSKKPQIMYWTNVIVIGLYSWILNFSYSSMRVWFKQISNKWLKQNEVNRYDQLGFVGLAICLFNPACFASVGMILSFSICIVVYFLIKFNLNNKILMSLLINISAFIITLPFIIDMNHKISLLTFINSFVFVYFSSFIFLYNFIFAWMPFLAVVHRGIIVSSYVLIGNISFSNVFIYSSSWLVWVKFIYFGLVVALFNLLYLIVKNNKI